MLCTEMLKLPKREVDVMRGSNQSYGTKIPFFGVAVFLLLMFVPRLVSAQTGAPDMQTFCDPDRPAPPQSQPEEAPCLSRFKDVVTRAGDALTFKLDNGSTKTIKGNAKACETGPDGCLIYRLVGYVAANRQFIVNVSEYESGLVLLISRRTGNITELEDWPHLSPSRKRFAVVAASDASDIKDAIAVFSTASDPPKLEWKFPTPKEYEQYAFDGWDGEDRVKLRVISKDNMATDLKLTAEGWRLSRPDGTYGLGISSAPPRRNPAAQPAANAAPQPAPGR